jgi:hypothetical protein
VKLGALGEAVLDRRSGPGKWLHHHLHVRLWSQQLVKIVAPHALPPINSKSFNERLTLCRDSRRVDV